MDETENKTDTTDAAIPVLWFDANRQLGEWLRANGPAVSAMSADRITVARFYLQPTTSFPEIAPQREEYADDRAYDRACVTYANEWRETYLCTGCSDVACPQCGAEGAVTP